MDDRVRTPAALEPWTVDGAAFPHTGSSTEQLAFLVGYAILAPSGHNTQPWLFRVTDRSVELFADRTRALAVVDPEDRELTISCGAALFNLRVAARHFGMHTHMDLLPDAAHPDLLARMHSDGGCASTPEDAPLFAAVTLRHVNRRSFEARDLAPDVMERLRQVVAREGAWLAVVQREQRSAVIDLVMEGDRRQWADRRFRRELAGWVHANRSSHLDGIRGYGLGFGEVMSAVAPLVMRTFDTGNQVAARDRQIAEDSPVLAVLGTTEDEPSAWLAAGQALEAALLHATAAGASASFLNQPIEVPELRPRLRDALGVAGHPQLLIRLGYGPLTEPEPRRPVRDVLLS